MQGLNSHIKTSTQHAHNLASKYALRSLKTYIHGIGDKMLVFKKKITIAFKSCVKKHNYVDICGTHQSEFF